MKKLAIITTHPIQYNAPFFKMLHDRGNVDVKVFYTWSQTETEKKFDPGFDMEVAWDIPLLEGYNYSFSKNISKKPGSAHFFGIDNPNLVKEITDFSPKAILVYGWSFKSHLKVMFHFANKIPVLFRGDSTLLDEQKGIKTVLRRLWLKFVYNKIVFGMYAGSANKSYFLAHGLKEEKLVFMPHAIDNIRFSKNEENIKNAVSLRNSLNIGKEEIVFLFVGKLESKKQPILLAECFLKSNVNAHLIFVGKGDLESKLKSIVSHHSNIHLLGFQNQSKMPSIYAASNIFVLPSSGPGETWGLAINEAMAAGNAIIASDACGASFDLILNNGFIVPKNNTDLLIDKLKNIVSDKSVLKNMCSNSLHIIANYSFENDCIAIEKVLNNTNKL